ncbi:MAG: cytochrome ubiquinol oxidase subunit I, partial [Deltaproteobacteria bacterium CG_4_9_14_3_um_filter_63_12]
DRPPVAVVHLAFQLMVACGSALALFGLTFLFLLVRRRRVPLQRGLLRAAVLCA